jgi:transcriptional regulator GlxA family with amidase domain
MHPDRAPGSRHIALLLFDGVDELDVVGPWEVLASWTRRHPEDGWAASCVSADGRPVTGAQGLLLGAHHSLATAPRADVLLQPGGVGTERLLTDDRHLDWLRGRRTDTTLLAATSRGSLVLAAAGLLTGRRATTHWASLNLLSEIDPTVVTDVAARFVDDGDLVTSAGAAAGIDLALHLVGRLAGPERAREVRRDLQHDPSPPG